MTRPIIRTDAIRFALNHPEEFEAMRREGQARVNALFAAHRAKVREEQERRWVFEQECG